MKSLLEGKKGRFEKIVGLSYDNKKIKQRLLELGFTPRQNIRLVRRSLLGETVLVEIRGYTLSLRKEIAKGILVD